MMEVMSRAFMASIACRQLSALACGCPVEAVDKGWCTLLGAPVSLALSDMMLHWGGATCEGAACCGVSGARSASILLPLRLLW